MSDLNEALCEEINALEAILSPEQELTVGNVESNQLCITTRITPLTALDTSRQYVGLYLKVLVNKDLYPDTQGPTDIEVFRVRGLDESHVGELLQMLKDHCDQAQGMAVIYDLIDACQEFLTSHNHPACPCSICLYHIVQEDSFVKTPCYHYFHAICFGRYIKAYVPIS